MRIEKEQFKTQKIKKMRYDLMNMDKNGRILQKSIFVKYGDFVNFIGEAIDAVYINKSEWIFVYEKYLQAWSIFCINKNDNNFLIS